MINTNQNVNIPTIAKLVSTLENRGFTNITFKINEQPVNSTFSPNVVASKGRKTYLFDVKTGVSKTSEYVRKKWNYLADVASGSNNTLLFIITAIGKQDDIKDILEEESIDAYVLEF